VTSTVAKDFIMHSVYIF